MSVSVHFVPELSLKVNTGFVYSIGITVEKQPVNRHSMIKTYFKIAWRNLLKNKAFSFINVFSLSIGIAVCFINLLFVQDELSYDRFNKKADRIVRVIFEASNPVKSLRTE